MKYNLKLLYVNLQIKNGPTFSIKYRHCNEKDFSITNDSEVITIIQKRPFREQCPIYTFGLAYPKVIITLPDDCETLNIIADMSNVSIHDIKPNIMAVKLTSGVLKMNHISANRIKAFCKNGAVKLKYIKVGEYCDVHSGNGLISAKQCINSVCGYKISCFNGVIRWHGIPRISIDRSIERSGNPKFIFTCDNGVCSVE